LLSVQSLPLGVAQLTADRVLFAQKSSFLGSHSVLKFGVGIGTDVKRLAAGFGVQTSGCVDLQHIAVRCGVR